MSDNLHDWASVKARVRESLSSYIYRRTKRSPMIFADPAGRLKAACPAGMWGLNHETQGWSGCSSRTVAVLVAVIAMVVPVALISPQWLIAPLVLVVVAFCVLWYGRRKLRSHVAAQLCSTDFENSRVQYSLAGLPIPTMLVPTGGSYGIIPSSGKKSWQAACGHAPGGTGVPGPEPRCLFPPARTGPDGGAAAVTAYSGAAKGSRGSSIVYLIDDTFYKDTLDEYNESRPACLIIVIDSYDELFDDMKDSEQAKELEAINSLLEQYIARSTGFLRRVSNSRYIAVVEERDVRWMMEERFTILEKVRALHPGGLTTLSIGVGHGGKTLAGMPPDGAGKHRHCAGRGGDQAAVKTVDGFEFYGGISHGVEKRSPVRSRIICNACAT